MSEELWNPFNPPESDEPRYETPHINKKTRHVYLDLSGVVNPNKYYKVIKEKNGIIKLEEEDEYK